VTGAAGAVLRRLAGTGVVGLAAMGMLLMIFTGGAEVRRTAPSTSGIACPTEDLTGDPDASLRLDGKQMRNARTIVAVAKATQGIGRRGTIAALAVALAESQIRNLANPTYPATMQHPDKEGVGGDRDSVGIYQQRPSQGWGTPEELMVPRRTAQKFLSRLKKVPNWKAMTINDAAQAVQRSGTPNVYAQYQQQAVDITAKLSGTVTADDADGAPCTPDTAVPGGPVGDMLTVALAQEGEPYVWGATGPDEFDCSGLIVYAWRRAGYQLSVRVSQDMHRIAAPVRAGHEKPGDLIFSTWSGSAGSSDPGHVALVVKPGTLIEAPRPGKNVTVRKYHRDSSITFGRLPSSALKRIKGN
jgi:cell wall-associated NlpC family hydrolase